MAASIENIQLNFELKEHQKSAIAYLLEGNDVFVVLPTGYGKTVIYSILPELFRKVKKIDNSVVLVVSPLVALMRDQKEQFLKQGIESVYLGEKLDKEICKKVCDGLIPILLMSPESLFSGVWRETLSLPVYQKCLSAVVIDEAHCVEEWGKEFRKDYSRLGELRSILPNAVMLALTATATKQSRKEIACYLQMQDYKLVLSSCDRSNIFYFCQEAPYSLTETFTWLISVIQLKGVSTPKTIIYCRNIKACSQIYALFLDKLGTDHSYCGQPSSKNCLFAMFHHATMDKNKRNILDNFFKSDCKTRVIIATTAFGMGINVPDIRYVIHWGAPRSLNGFMQESGRAGRDGNAAFSIVYYHNMNISVSATNVPMHDYCKLKLCRRQFLIMHFTPEESKTCKIIHQCCDICSKLCSCSDCNINSFGFILDKEDHAMASMCDESDKQYRNVTTQQRVQIKTALNELLYDMISNYDCTLINSDVITGLSEKIICEIVNNVHYIYDFGDIYQVFIYDKKLTDTVLTIINNVL